MLRQMKTTPASEVNRNIYDATRDESWLIAAMAFSTRRKTGPYGVGASPQSGSTPL